MTERSIRHIAVIDDDGDLVGVVSADRALGPAAPLPTGPLTGAQSAALSRDPRNCARSNSSPAW
ncbi:MAG: hypothetical protein ACJ76N_18990 [Thermoanaerobaculia bacterium]